MIYFRLIALITILTMHTTQGMDWFYGMMGYPHAVDVPSDYASNTVKFNNSLCLGRQVKLANGAKLIQLNVANQFGQKGGGGLSCAYHALKNSDLIVQHLLTGYPRDLSQALNSTDIIKNLFGEGDAENNMGTWRQRILDTRTLLPIKQSLLSALEKKIPSRIELIYINPSNIIGEKHALSVHAGFKKMIRNHADTLATSLCRDQKIHVIEASAHLRSAFSSSYQDSPDRDIKNAVEYMQKTNPADTENSLFSGTEHLIVDTSQVDNPINSEHLTKEELQELVKQEFSKEGRFFTIMERGIPRETLIPVHKPITLDGLNFLTKSIDHTNHEATVESLYAQKDILLQKIAKIKRRTQEENHIQAVLLGSMSHAVGEDGENHDGHWISLVINKNKDNGEIEYIGTNSANDEPIERCGMTMAFLDTLTKTQ
jgi:hypothetical protein